MMYRLIENQLNKIGEYDTRGHAIYDAKQRHQAHPKRYHEVYGPQGGIYQLKPNDCIHGFPYGVECKKCNPYIGLKLLFWRYDLYQSL